MSRSSSGFAKASEHTQEAFLGLIAEILSAGVVDDNFDIDGGDSGVDAGPGHPHWRHGISSSVPKPSAATVPTQAESKCHTRCQE